jgi:hypothetical protein
MAYHWSGAIVARTALGLRMYARVTSAGNLRIVVVAISAARASFAIAVSVVIDARACTRV